MVRFYTAAPADPGRIDVVEHRPLFAV